MIIPISAVSSNWDIPVLALSADLRLALLHRACAATRQNGALVQLKKALVLIYRDEVDSLIFCHNAFRAWACTPSSLDAEDLAQVVDVARTLQADFMALSSWYPTPEGVGFFSVGTSIHARVDALAEAVLRGSIEIVPLGRAAEAWQAPIMQHMRDARWHDRHASDPHLDAARVMQRRLDWLADQLRYGDGFLIVILEKGRLAAYVLVPLDKSRTALGGPLVAGLNAVAGSLEEGRWFLQRALKVAIRHAWSLGCSVVVQYQPTNRAMAMVARRLLTCANCVRYDAHWHRRF